MKSPVIVEMHRTPFCRAGEEKGWLANYRADDLAALLIKSLLNKTEVSPDSIDEVLIGSSNQRGPQSTMARSITLISGLPHKTASLNMERACISSMSAVQIAAMSISYGMGEVYLAGGAETMTRFRIPKFSVGQKPTPEEYERLTGKAPNPRLGEVISTEAMGMGVTAEKLADLFEISREEQDKWAVRSNHLADKAYREGKFKEEVIPIRTVFQNKEMIIDRDQEIRAETNLESITNLRTPFKVNGTVTAANASKESDGASMMLVMSEEKANKLGLKPLARIVDMAVTGVDPTIMGYGATEAARKLLNKTNLRTSHIDLWEINEAFAVVVLVAIQELGIDPDLVNVNGGACAIGHPTGASGVRIIGTLAKELQRQGKKYGMASICGGMGQGGAVLLESL